MFDSKMVSINEAPQVEPMRKRSSSATEATKPLNDMQRKIVQTLSEFQLYSVAGFYLNLEQI